MFVQECFDSRLQADHKNRNSHNLKIKFGRSNKIGEVGTECVAAALSKLRQLAHLMLDLR